MIIHNPNAARSASHILDMQKRMFCNTIIDNKRSQQIKYTRAFTLIEADSQIKKYFYVTLKEKNKVPKNIFNGPYAQRSF